MRPSVIRCGRRRRSGSTRSYEQRANNQGPNQFSIHDKPPFSPGHLAEVSGPEHGMRSVRPSTSTFLTRSENVGSCGSRLFLDNSAQAKRLLFLVLLR